VHHLGTGDGESGHQLLARTKQVRERFRSSLAEVDEDQTVPHHDVRGRQGVLRGIEGVRHSRRALQRAVEAVRPLVVRADEPLLGATPRVDQARAAVPAHVRESREAAVGAAGHDHALSAALDGHVLSRLCQLGLVASVQPTVPEDLRHLVCEQLLREVELARDADAPVDVVAHDPAVGRALCCGCHPCSHPLRNALMIAK